MVSPNQYLELETTGEESGCFIFFNRDFYCIQVHDQEVACDGLLFNNIRNMPKVELSKAENIFLVGLFKEMVQKFNLNDSSLEEMVRTYLKQLLMRDTLGRPLIAVSDGRHMNTTFDPDGQQIRRKAFSKHDSFRNAPAENFGFKDVRILDGNIGY